MPIDIAAFAYAAAVAGGGVLGYVKSSEFDFARPSVSGRLSVSAPRLTILSKFRRFHTLAGRGPPLRFGAGLRRLPDLPGSDQRRGFSWDQHSPRGPDGIPILQQRKDNASRSNRDTEVSRRHSPLRIQRVHFVLTSKLYLFSALLWS